MSKATGADGELQVLAKCQILTPTDIIYLKILPEISDSKGANYQSEPIQGRTTPVMNYAYSEPRMISSELTFMITTSQDIFDNIKYLRLIESLVYPGDAAGGSPYTPPPVCKFYCGQLLGEAGVCVVLKNYSVKFPTDVAWDVETYLPYKFSISCQWEVVYACSSIPTNSMIRTAGNYYKNPPSTVPMIWNIPPREVDQEYV